MFKLPIIAWGLAALLLAVVAVAAGLAPAGAHDDVAPPAAPANARVADGATVGAVVMAWDAVDGAAFYRIGWVAMDDIPAARAEGREWLDAFVFADVANRGQTTYTITGLVPGRDYAFIVASVSRRFGAGAWSEWAYLTPAGVASCPAGGGEPTPAPPATPAAPAATPTATPAPTQTPTPRPVADGAGGRSYDADGDGLIEVSNLAQLAAIRADLNGDGASPAPGYAAAFPEAMAGMGCPDSGCTGYELVADLDFDTNGNGEADEGDAYWNDGAGWIPIGDARHKFTADFDGNNHTIANLYINYSNRREDYYVGLFGYASDSSIKQIGIVFAVVSGYRSTGGLVGGSSGGEISDSYVTGSVSGDYSVGGLVGSRNGGTISGSYTTVSVSGRRWVGGLVGGNSGTISASYATSSVSGGTDVGGLVGWNSGSTISGSYAMGIVSGDDYVGGLIGSSSGAISGNYAAGRVSGNDHVGGLIGSNDGTVSASYATGSVSGNDSVGGFIGSSNGGAISGSYATGNVSGDNYVGGLVGEQSGNTISASYAMGSVSGGGDDIGGLVGRNENGAITASYAAGRVSISVAAFYIGGLVGYDEGGAITDSYWDTQASGQGSSYGGVGQTTAELQSPTGYASIYADWNLDLDGDGEGDEPWDFGGSGQYPVLQYGGLDVGAQRR